MTEFTRVQNQLMFWRNRFLNLVRFLPVFLTIDSFLTP